MRFSKPTTLVAVTVALACAPFAWAGPAAPSGDPHEAFAQTDTNHDGVIDRGEYAARVTEVFYFADKDKDGFLEVDEQKALVFPEDFSTDDKDANGRISLHEFERVRFQDFEKSDTNDDGVLSIDEVVATYEEKGR